MNKRQFLGSLGALGLTPWLGGCGPSDSGGQVRLVNASPDYTLDLYIDDDRVRAGVAYGTASGFTDGGSGSVTAKLTAANASTSLATQSNDLSSDSNYSVLAYGWKGAFGAMWLGESEDDADKNETSLRVVHTATDADALDVYLTLDVDDLDEATAVLSSVALESVSDFSTLDASSGYRLRVCAADDNTDVRLDVSGLTLPSKGVVTLVLAPSDGGVLVHAMQLVQDGDTTLWSNPQARVRVIHAVGGSPTLTLLAGSQRLTSSLSAPSIKSHALVTAADITFTATLAGSTVVSTTSTIAGGEDWTVLLVGADAASAQMVLIADDSRRPVSSTKFRIRLLHASNSLSSESLTLTLSLNELVSEQAYGAASDYTSYKAATTGTLTVSSLSSGTAVASVSVDDNNLEAEAVYTVVVYDTADGTPTGVVVQDR